MSVQHDTTRHGAANGAPGGRLAVAPPPGGTPATSAAIDAAAAATVTQRQAASLLGCSLRTVQRRVSTGELPTIEDATGVRHVRRDALPAMTPPMAAVAAPPPRRPPVAVAAVAVDLTPLVAVLAVELRHAQQALETARAEAATHAAMAASLADASRLVLDGRWRARRRARTQLRGLLDA